MEEKPMTNNEEENLKVNNEEERLEANNEEEKPEIKFSDKFKKWWGTRKDRLILVILVSLAFPMVTFICTPFDIYAHNAKEYIFTWGSFMPYLITFGLLLALVLAAILFVLPRKAYLISAYVLLAFTFMFFLQGTFLNVGLNLTDAGMNDGYNKKAIVLTVFNSLLWLALIAGAVVAALFKDKKGYIKMVAYFLSALVLITQVTTVISDSANDPSLYYTYAKRERVNGKPQALTYTDENTVSQDGNIYFIVIDRFDQAYAEDALERKPELYDIFEGFTMFTDNISKYSHTYPSMSHLITNRQYDITKNREDTLRSVFLGDTPTKDLHDKGYDIRLYTQPYYVYSYSGIGLPDYADNCVSGTYRTLHPVRISMQMLKCSFYRTFPSALKIVFSGTGSHLSNRHVGFTGEDGSDQSYVDNKKTWEYLQAHEFEVKDGKSFTLVHIEGTHDIFYDADFNKLSLFDKKDIIYSVENSFKVVNKFLQALKDNGLYENSTIVITGDHGVPYDNHSSLSRPNRTALMVKPKGVGSGELKYNAAQVSHNDIWPTIFKSEGLEAADENIRNSPSVFDIPENENRSRWFVHHTYRRAGLEEYHYTITGPSKEWSNWKEDKDLFRHVNRYIMD